MTRRISRAGHQTVEKASNKGLGPARAKERKAMEILSDIVLGVLPLNLDEIPMDVRQLGYLASLAKGQEYDRESRLAELSKMCRAVISTSKVDMEASREANCPIQRSWGAPWHMDASKLRRELPLHIGKKKKSQPS